MQNRNDCAAAARAVLDTISAHDLDALARLYAKNSETITMPTGERSFGPEGARSDTQRWLAAFPDLRFEIRSVVASDDAACIEATVHGTNTGPLALPGEELPPTNKAVSMPVCVVMRFDDEGKLVAEHDYFDLVTMMEQLGLSEPAPSHARTTEAAAQPGG